jgi:hypothetical protein
MLHAFGEAITFIREKPFILIGVGFLLLLQVGIATLQSPVANHFVSTLDYGSLLEAFDSIQLVVFIALAFVGLILNFAGLLWIAQQVKVWKQHTQEKTSLQLLKAAGLVAIATIVLAGLIIGMTLVLSLLLEFLGFIGLFVLGVMILLFLYIMIKFTFTLVLMGFGLGLKHSLQQSWRITQGHFLLTVVLLLGIGLITGIGDAVTQLIIASLETELIAIPFNFIVTTLLTTYAVAVMACAVPLDTINSVTPKHVHGKKRFA